jgi:arsenate reductase-like glutaredoxin family protein
LHGDIYMLKDCKSTLSITAKHLQNPHDLRYSVHYTIADNPTKDMILSLLKGLGDPDGTTDI